MTAYITKVIIQCRYLGVRNSINSIFPKYSPFTNSFHPITWSQIKWYANKKGTGKDLVAQDIFQMIQTKNKQTYLELLNIFKENETKRTGHVEFIYVALKYMKEFNVEKDLDVYKSLIDVLPKGKLIPRNMFQVEFMHYPKQQQCAIDLLEQMEENGVMPDWNMEDQLVNVFGKRGYPVRRYWRMMYWMPKFKNASPWLLPQTVPKDTFELAMLAIERITSVDVNTKITVFKTSEIKDSLEDTWIISGQSEEQMGLLKNLPDKTPIYVEGRFRIWLRNTSVTYFILKANVQKQVKAEEDMDDVSNLQMPFFSKPTSDLQTIPSIHEQDNDIILAVCSTGTSSRDSVLSWIRFLENINPRLGELPIIFTLRAPIGDGLITTDNNASNETDSLNKETPKT